MASLDTMDYDYEDEHEEYGARDPEMPPVPIRVDEAKAGTAEGLPELQTAEMGHSRVGSVEKEGWKLVQTGYSAMSKQREFLDLSNFLAPIDPVAASADRSRLRQLAGAGARKPHGTRSRYNSGCHCFHHASAKHLFRYVDEFTWRLNEGNVIHHTLNRLAAFVDATVGKRLTYKRLIAPVEAKA